MPLPEEMPMEAQQRSPVPTPPEKRFISVATDAIQDEYTKFTNPALSLAERVRAGHRFLGTASQELMAFPEERRFAAGVSAAYVPPRVRISVAVTTDRIAVRRISLGAASTEAVSDVALQDDPRPFIEMLKDQQHEQYYNGVLSAVVTLALVRLAKHKIIREHPRQLTVSFATALAPLASSLEEEDHA